MKTLHCRTGGRVLLTPVPAALSCLHWSFVIYDDSNFDDTGGPRSGANSMKISIAPALTCLAARAPPIELEPLGLNNSPRRLPQYLRLLERSL